MAPGQPAEAKDYIFKAVGLEKGVFVLPGGFGGAGASGFSVRGCLSDGRSYGFF